MHAPQPANQPVDKVHEAGRAEERILSIWLKLFNRPEMASFPVSWHGVENADGTKSYGDNVTFESIMRQGKILFDNGVRDPALTRLVAERLQDWIIGLNEEQKVIGQETACDLIKIFQDPKNVEYFLENYKLRDSPKGFEIKEKIEPAFQEVQGELLQTTEGTLDFEGGAESIPRFGRGSREGCSDLAEVFAKRLDMAKNKTIDRINDLSRKTLKPGISPRALKERVEADPALIGLVEYAGAEVFETLKETHERGTAAGRGVLGAEDVETINKVMDAMDGKMLETVNVVMDRIRQELSKPQRDQGPWR